MQKKEREERIGESRWNKWYGRIEEKGVSKYMKEGWEERRCKRIAKIRLEGGLRERRY